MEDKASEALRAKFRTNKRTLNLLSGALRLYGSTVLLFYSKQVCVKLML